MRVKWWIVTALAVVLIGTAVLIFTRPDDSQGNAPKDEPDSVIRHSLEQFDLDNQPVKGDPQAPLQIVEIGEYKCASCGKWTETVYPELVERYIDTGKAAFYYVNEAFLGMDSMNAAMGGEYMHALGDDLFWRYHERVLENQGSKDEEWATIDFLTSLVEQHLPEVDSQDFRTALEQETYKTQVQADMNASTLLGVERVPSIYVNGRLVEGNTIDALVTVIEDELNRVNG